MRRRTFLQAAAMAAAGLATRGSAEEPARVLALGGRRELFVDRYLIERTSGVELRLATPRDEGIAVKLDAPWEGPYSNYATALRDGDRRLLFYRGRPAAGRDGDDGEQTCVALSDDGLRWTKPQLGLFDYQGSKANNIVLAGAAPATHNFSPMVDDRPGVPAAERFKAVGGAVDKLFGFVSADGLKWNRIRPEPLITKAHVPFPHVHLFDSQNVVHWSPAEQAYVCYFRVWDGLRKIARTTSRNFLDWTPAVMMRQLHDDGVRGPRPAPAEHLYTNQTFPYFRAPHLSIALAARFFEGRQVVTAEQAKRLGVQGDYFRDTSDAVLMSTRGGDVYDRTFLDGFLKPGVGLANWVSRANYPALNVLQTGPHEMSFYVDQEYAQPTNHLRRYSLRLDGFAAVRAGAAGGELTTKPFTMDGRRLAVNFATSAAGGLRVELQDADGKPLPGYALDECREQIGNEIERMVTWKNGEELGALAGRPLRMRFVLSDCELFAFQFQG